MYVILNKSLHSLFLSWYTYLVERLMTDVRNTVWMKDSVDRIQPGNSIQLGRLF